MTVIPYVFKKYVKGTAKKAPVQLLQVFLCHLTVAVMKGVGIPCSKVYITTRVIKHIYDKRPAEEFDYCIETALSVVKYPSKIYKNKSGKRGSFCFVKEVKNSLCFVSIETFCDQEGKPTHCEVATFFRPAAGYLDSFKLCGSGRMAFLHRNAFDSGLTQPTCTPQ